MSEDPVAYGESKKEAPAGRLGRCEAAGRVDPVAVRLAWERALARSGKTRREIAAVCKVTPAAVSAWICGRRRPAVENLLQAACALGSTPADLLGWWGASSSWVNGDLLRLALEENPVREVGVPEVERLRAIRDFSFGMSASDAVTKRKYIRLALVRMLDVLAKLEEDQGSLLADGVGDPEGHDR
jgi:transcriptional regulator with XRE-family HTH domain